MKVLMFAIDHQRFGIRIDDIQEVIRAVRLAPLPKAPAVIEGLIDLRGTVVPVLGIRSRFRLPSRTIEPADHIVIARASERTIGLRVDRVIDILTLTDEIADISGVAPTSEYVAGVAKLPDGLVLIHDLATFLSDAEARALSEVIEQGLPS